MIKHTFTQVIVSLLLVFGSGLAQAEDIDIFSQNTTVTAGAPNVLIVMDNSANWSSSLGGSTKFAAEMVALQQVVSALRTQFNLGIAFYSESGTGNSNVQGGYVRFAIQGMTDSNGNATAARNCLLYMVGGSEACSISKPGYTVLDIGNDKGSANYLSLGMADAYRYFAGLNAYSGNDKVKADPLAFVSGTTAGPLYSSPITVANCQKNFIIHINNGPNESASSVTEANTLLTSDGGDATMISPPDSSSKNSAADEWTRFLYKVSTVNAVTYTLEVGPDTNTTGLYNTALLQSMGRQGKGGYYAATDSQTLLEALTKIFNDIQATNSVFASSSLPLSADNSGSFLNQVYMGVFRPDGQGRPRWYGNLKQYKFKLDSAKNVFLAGRDGVAVASPEGFAKPDALSFWTGLDDDFTYTTTPPAAPYTSTPDSAATYSTNPGTGGFWYFDSKGSGGSYDAVDGEWVEKGGAAQRLRLAYLGYGNNKAGVARGSIGTSSSTGRKVYTCTGTCLTTSGTALVGTAASNTTFDSSNTLITKEVLGAADATVTSIVSATSKSVTTLIAGGSAQTLSSISKSSGGGTATTSADHGFTSGDTVVIAGAGNPLNGTYVITVTNSTTFTFVASNGTASTTSGTVTKATTTATATVASHGFVVGQRLTIAGATPSTFNGVILVSTVPTANTFTYTLGSALAQTATGTITATSNTATAAATAHGLVTGNTVTIAGATPTGYNGVYLITKISDDSFSYSYTTAAPLANSSGTITASIGGGRTTLINWIRGVDTQDENGDGRTTDVRASIHGDVLHSRPLVLNYSSAPTPDDVYLFYGGNDGVFRAVKGGQGASDGVEQWAFIPQEFFGKFKRLYDNSPQVAYPSTPSGIVPTPTARDYFWDGPVGSYIERNSSGVVTKAYLYIATRRGGRFIYALDVTSVTAPKFLWKKGCPNLANNTGCDAGFEEMGQTWSQPQIINVAGHTNPVLVFGGGYDPVSEDPDTPAATDTMGRGVFMLDAYDGSVVWSAGHSDHSPTLSVTGMDFSIAADVLPIDRNFDGLFDRVYAADVGGNLWRLDIGDVDKANWRVWKIASVGNRGTLATTRKFLFGMDMVRASTANNFDAIVIGTGDREHPLATNDANDAINRVYMFKDTNTGATGANLDIVDDCGAIAATVDCRDLFNATSRSTVPVDKKGWFITLATGEKVVNSPVVAGSNMLFGTNQPDTSNLTCTPNLGIARRYSVNYLTAVGSKKDSSGVAVRFEQAAGGGFLPSPIIGVVDVDGTKVVLAADNPLSGDPTKVDPTVSTKRFRTYWYQKLD